MISATHPCGACKLESLTYECKGLAMPPTARIRYSISISAFYLSGLRDKHPEYVTQPIHPEYVV